MNKGLITNLPKSFNVEVEYFDGTKKNLECADRVIHENEYEFLNTDNTYTFVPKSNVKFLHFDKNYSKIIEQVAKMNKAVKEEEKNNEKKWEDIIYTKW